uniref:protoporphyrinogen/coproporphyrinogen oxidase n=1 Tax=Bowdeniella massiliensis TaxID=2932264 RepID=UPI002027EE15
MRPVVIGGGFAGLVAAYELARAGHRPLMLEARGYTGGLIAALPVAGTDILADIGAESFATRGGAVAGLAADLGLSVAPPAGRSWVLAADGTPIRIPAGILGIPGYLDPPGITDSDDAGIDADLRAALTTDELARALEDLTMGGDIGTDCADLASFVTARLGEAVLTKLVAPVAGGIHSAPPSSLAIDVVAPGLRAATRKYGSLMRAVTALRQLPTPPPIVVQVVGGMHLLTSALAREIVAAGGEIRTRTGVLGLRRGTPEHDTVRDDRGEAWLLDVADMAPARGPHLEPAGPTRELAADRVIVACSGPHALRLLAGALDIEPWDMPEGSPIAHLTMLLRAPALDAAPRGSGMLVTKGAHSAAGAPVGAKALTHMSEKWPWLGEALRAQLGPHHHLVRLSYGRHGEPYPQPSVPAALADLAAMTGADLAASDVLAHRLIRWDGTLAPPTPQHRANVAVLTERLAAIPSLAATGAWLAGSGLAAILPHARSAAASLGAPTPVD